MSCWNCRPQSQSFRPIYSGLTLVFQTLKFRKNPYFIDLLYVGPHFEVLNLKVHKIENFFYSDFEFCVISLLVMLKY